MTRALHWAAAGSAALLLVATGCGGKRARPANAAVPVTTARVHRAPVPYSIAANGVVTPVQTATVAPQVDGLVLRVAFEEGQDVTQGQTLFAIDPRPYQAAYDQAAAALARDRAAAANAHREADRYTTLEQQSYVTVEQADLERTTAASADATVAADEAALATAKFNLGNTTIRAPIAGRTGGLIVRPGNIVHAASGTPLVVINQIKPILVRFAVPGGQLPLIQRYRAAGALPLSALPGASPVTLGGPPSGPDPAGGAAMGADPPGVTPADSVGTVHGTLSFIDNAVDTTTGTVMLKGLFPNAAGTLWPGAFVPVTLRLVVEANALVVPATAVLTGQQGTYVYVADSAGRAATRPVTVARTAPDLAVIATGLREGETVITGGQSRLTPGAQVAVRAPSDSGARAPRPHRKP